MSDIETLINLWEMESVPDELSKDARAELAQLRASIATLTEQNAQQAARIAELENDVICAFCGTHYHADDVPPEHWRMCDKSPLVQRIKELEAQQVTP